MEGDLYVPVGTSPGIVLVHGAAPLGAHDPRIERLAEALARAGRVVLVPQLELRHRVFDASDIERLVAAERFLEGSPVVDGSVGYLGISYGGSFALVAAADPRIADRVGFVATFGAYLDIRHVIQGITTHATTPEGKVEAWEPAPQAAGILLNQSAKLLSLGDARALREALEGERPPEELSDEARAFYDVLSNRDPRRALELVARLPEDVLSRLDLFSPVHYLAAIRAPVAVMHSEFDPAVPPSEGRLLADTLRAPLFHLDRFRHVSPGELLSGLPDLWRATRFAAWVLARG
jgi:pimeloyl-ACP methyl ester carboxylesterase